jgi:hypothetical protein
MRAWRLALEERRHGERTLVKKASFRKPELLCLLLLVLLELAPLSPVTAQQAYETGYRPFETGALTPVRLGGRRLL